MPSERLINENTLGPKPLDLAHHFSRASRKRVPNVMKEYYKYLRLPGMGSLAGGCPFPGYFPFNTIECSIVQPGHLTSTSETNGCDGGNTAHINIERSSMGPSSMRTIDLNTALQYGSAQGYPPLSAWLKKLTNDVYHPNIPYTGGADVMINGGSADGLAKVYELLFDHWDAALNNIRDREGLIVEEFIYPPPLAQLRTRDVNVVPVKMDVEGLLAYGAGSLFETLQTWDYSRGKRPHAVYLIPTGQNPTSGVLSFSRRKEIYQVCSQFDLIIIEDDPYWTLYYPSARREMGEIRRASGSTDFPAASKHRYCTSSPGGRSTGYRFLDELIPSFLSIDVDGRIIRLDTFSKTIAPGCRLGWITAQPGICEQLFRVTDGTTQQPSGFAQAIVLQLIGDFSIPNSTESATVGISKKASGWGIDGWVVWLEGLRDTYQQRMITMATIFEKGRFLTSPTGETEMFTFNWPMGGMFIWLEINISNHPLALNFTPQRLTLALWILCTKPPFLILTNPGWDFAASETIKEAHGYRFFRFCFAAVEQSLLEAKSQAFVEACQKFWTIRDVEEIDHILQADDALHSKNNADMDDVKLYREMVEDW